MCAIFGAYRRPDLDLEGMARALHHRGPDGEGYFSKAGDFQVGMCRLAILDLAHGQQPYRSPDGAVQVVCNGEIYNWKELREILAAKGYSFHTQNDCEVLPAAWQEWGPAMLDRLNGMFALALYDAGKEELFLARDRCGQKPLYYYREGESMIFASEVKGLQAAGVPMQVNEEAISSYLRLRYVPEPITMFAGIETLPAAHWMKISSRGVEIRRYWDLPERSKRDPFKGSEKEAVQELGRLVDDSVALCLQSDVPVATYLSAGVDSSLLAESIQRQGGQVEAISIGYRDSSDESAEAALFAKSLGMSHHVVKCSGKDLLELPRVVKQMERPVGDALVVAFDRLAATTRELGCQVALGGEGADEIFAGYSFHSAMLKAERLGAVGRGLGSLALKFVPPPLLDRISQFPGTMGIEGRAKLGNYLKKFSGMGALDRGRELRSLMSAAEVGKVRPGSGGEILAPEFQHSGDLLDDHLRYHFREWMQDWAMIRQEKNAMAHSLEYRIPFLDHRVIEFGFSLPNEWKWRGKEDKWIWRQLAEKRLPKRLTQRAKQPFYFPAPSFEERGEFRDLIHDSLSRLEQRGYFEQGAILELLDQAEKSSSFLPGKQVMAFVVLELWHQEFIDLL